MQTHVGTRGYAIATCDFCRATTEFIGAGQAEEKVKSKGWTIRHGKVRCAACTEIERLALAGAVRRILP